MSQATPRDVARLFARAAFGATKNDLAKWVGVEYDLVVDSLFPPLENRVPEPDEPRRVALESNQNGQADKRLAQRWWLDRMRTATYPLEERMTWFWHTHFATAWNGPPNVNHLMRQNQTIRRNALGSFRTMVEELTVDGAMLYWLSGTTNKAGAVNENYARELFELFTAGTIPQRYDEDDVKEAAKALSGWQVLGDGKTEFYPGRHVQGKKYLGDPPQREIGGHAPGSAAEKAEYKEVVDYALSLDSAPLFVAYKLVSAFAYVPSSTDLVARPDVLVTAVAAALGASWDLRAALRTLLTHSAFRDAPVGSYVRPPVEITVHLAKVMGIDCDPEAAVAVNPGSEAANHPILPLLRMGQLPFEPPNVGGWPKDHRWLSATTTLGRYALPIQLDLAAKNQNAYAVNPLPPSGDLAAWAQFVGLGELDPLTEQQVRAYLAAPATTKEDVKQVGVLALLTTSPQWQVV